jgi:alkylation response protein AidB-like acyl-CoA dehydrogenase
MDMAVGGWRAAVRTIDPEIVQTFASRNAAAARAALDATVARS